MLRIMSSSESAAAGKTELESRYESQLVILEEKIGTVLFRQYLELDVHDKMTYISKTTNINKGLAKLVHEYSTIDSNHYSLQHYEFIHIQEYAFKNKTPNIRPNFDFEQQNCPLMNAGKIYFEFHKAYRVSKPTEEFHAVVIQHSRDGLYRCVETEEHYSAGSYLTNDGAFYYSTLEELLEKHKNFKLGKESDEFCETFGAAFSREYNL